MRSDSSAPSQDASSPQAKATPRPHIVPVDTTPDAISLFVSEDTLPDFRTRPAPPRGREAVSLPPERAKQGIWRNILFAVLAVAVLTQAGFIAFWMLSDRAAAALPGSGSVTVTSEPSGSPVTIDGTERGVTPLTVTLATGSHNISVGAGAQTRSQNMNVTRGGEASVHVALGGVPAANATTGTGGLQIATEPPGARVWIDGEPRGAAPVTVSELTVGDHVVTVRSGSGEAVNRTVNVQEATLGTLVITMNGSAAFASGWLAVTSAVPLQIRENGTVVGTTDTPRILLPAGAHELELVNTSLDYRVARSVRISAGQTTAIGLQAPIGTLSINALPWAEVWIDGQRAGETPIGNFSIAIGTHELLFRHPELGEQRMTVSVGAVAPQRVGVDMRKR